MEPTRTSPLHLKDILLQVKDQSSKASDIFPLPKEAQVRIKQKLDGCEKRLNLLFSSAIPVDRVSVAHTVEFMPTPIFFEEAILNNKDFPKTPIEVTSLMLETFDTQGMRSPDGKRIMVHTTVFPRGKEPRQATEIEAYRWAKHELIHGKLKPRIFKIGPGKIERRTGLKKISFEDGQITDVQHASLYEAQTDALAVISDHPEIDSWDQVSKIYSQEYIEETGLKAGIVRVWQISALTKLMAASDYSFSAGLHVLGETYFRCDGDLFFESVEKRMGEIPNREVTEAFQEFVAASGRNKEYEMNESATRLAQARTDYQRK